MTACPPSEKFRMARVSKTENRGQIPIFSLNARPMEPDPFDLRTRATNRFQVASASNAAACTKVCIAR